MARLEFGRSSSRRPGIRKNGKRKSEFVLYIGKGMLYGISQLVHDELREKLKNGKESEKIDALRKVKNIFKKVMCAL